MYVRSLLLFVATVLTTASSFAQPINLKKPKIKAEASGNSFILSLDPEPPPPIKPVGSGRSEPEWLYFWEFGDGHYSEEKNPLHAFTQKGKLPVNVYLTPAYSLDKPLKISDEVDIDKTGGAPSKRGYPSLGRNSFIRISTNNNELVMREDLQLVIHYKPPPGHNSGFIALAFNEKTAAKRSFKYASERTYYGERAVDDIFEVAEVANNADNQNLLDKQAGDFQQIYAFKYQNKSPSESYRLFITLRVETPAVGSQIGLKAFLMPEKGSMPSSGTSNLKTMTILASHDPNRITVVPRVVEYPVPTDTIFRYKLFFQNKGEGVAKGLTVRVTRDSTMNIDSMKIQGAKIATEPCPMCNVVRNPRASCLDTIISEKYIDFIFKNVLLYGTRGKETLTSDQTKGEIQFSIKPKVVTNKKGIIQVPEVDAVVTRGAIKFDTDNDTVFTNEIDTQFRMRSFAAKVGYNAGRPLSELRGDAEGLSNVMLSVSYTDNPVHRGLAWESELAYSSFRYTREKNSVFPNENVLNLTDTLRTNLALNLYYLDVLGQSRYHFSDYIGLGFGAGFSTLLIGKGTLDARLDKSSEPDPELVSQEIRIGLAHARKAEQPINFESGDSFDPEIRNNPGSYLAMVMFADLGFGTVNKGPMLGIRYGSRFQNGLFDFSFARQNYIQIYFQWKF